MARGKQNCCCDPTIVELYAGSLDSSRLYVIDVETGDYEILSEGEITYIRVITCSPLTGRIYIAGGAGEVVCLSQNGTVIWSTTIGGGDQISDLCVSNDNSLYASFYTGLVRKMDADDGSEITSGSWPYTDVGTVAGTVCVSQGGNVYVGGLQAVAKLDSTGALQWRVGVSISGVATVEAQTARGIAVDPTDTHVAVIGDANQGERILTVLLTPLGTAHRQQIVLNVGGSFGKVVDCTSEDLEIWGRGKQGSSVSAIYATRENFIGSLSHWTVPTGLMGDKGLQGLVGSRSIERTYVVGDPYDLGSGAYEPNVFAFRWAGTSYVQLWQTTILEDKTLFCCELQEGRIGAFGL